VDTRRREESNHPAGRANALTGTSGAKELPACGAKTFAPAGSGSATTGPAAARVIIAASTAAILEERMAPMKLDTRLQPVNRNQGLGCNRVDVTQS
jgi:hypothetical protein